MSDVPILGSLVGGGKKAGGTTVVKEVPEGPRRDSAVVQRAAADIARKNKLRRGRRSTILTDSDFEQGTVRRKTALGGFA